MYMVVSPAKKLNTNYPNLHDSTQPALLSQAEELVSGLQKLETDDLKAMMKISHKLADLNYSRFQEFTTPFTNENSGPALYMFAGDTYVGLDATTLDPQDISFAQKHLGILSGLYGLLRPADLMQPYRLEMGTNVQRAEGGKFKLYQFWGDQIAAEIKKQLKDHTDKRIINLASNEYFHAIAPHFTKEQILNIVFKENRDGNLKTIGLFAKRARGMMARYVIQERLHKPEGLKRFDSGNYRYRDDLSSQNDWVFVR